MSLDLFASEGFAREDAPDLLARRLRAAVVAILFGSVPFTMLDTSLPEEAYGPTVSIRLAEVAIFAGIVLALRFFDAKRVVFLFAFLALVTFVHGAAALGVVGDDSLAPVMVAQLSLLSTAAFFPWGAAAQIAATAIVFSAVAWVMFTTGPVGWPTSFPVVTLVAGAAFSVYVARENERRRTALARSIAALRESEDGFRTIVEGAPDAVVLSRVRDGKIAAVNAPFSELSGYARDEVLGRTAKELDLWVDPTQQARGRERLERGETITNLEATFRRKDGSHRNGLASARVLPIRGEPHIVTYVRDVTDRHAVEQMRRDLVAMISHDIKNPLGTILGFAGIVREALPDASAEVGDSLDRIAANARKALLLADNFVQAARIESGADDLRREPAELAAIADDAVRSVEGWARTRGIHLVHRRLAPTPRLSLDRDRMERAVANLLSNAIKYSPASGEVEIETTVEDGEAVVRVRDHGPGVSEEDRGRLFQRYRRGADGRVSGTGLGLFIVRSTVAAHGGRVAFDAPPDGGSRFEIRVPLAPATRTGEESSP